jgi:hypothetical protein
MQCYYNRVIRNGIKYRLVEGVRYRGAVPSAFAHIVADCKQCHESIGIELEHYRDESKVTDEDVANIFRKEGWAIDLTTKPRSIICPLCNKHEKTHFVTVVNM